VKYKHLEIIGSTITRIFAIFYVLCIVIYGILGIANTYTMVIESLSLILGLFGGSLTISAWRIEKYVKKRRKARSEEC
jgi:hypothetical protein